MLTYVDETVKVDFASLILQRAGGLPCPEEDPYSPPTAGASGSHHLLWALPRVLYAVSEIRRLAGSTRGAQLPIVPPD